MTTCVPPTEMFIYFVQYKCSFYLDSNYRITVKKTHRNYYEVNLFSGDIHKNCKI